MTLQTSVNSRATTIAYLDPAKVLKGLPLDSCEVIEDCPSLDDAVHAARERIRHRKAWMGVVEVEAPFLGTRYDVHKSDLYLWGAKSRGQKRTQSPCLEPFGC